MTVPAAVLIQLIAQLILNAPELAKVFSVNPDFQVTLDDIVLESREDLEAQVDAMIAAEREEEDE